MSRQGLSTIGVTIVALALGSFITDQLPKPEEVAREPLVTDARIGEPVTLRTGTFTVTKIEAASSVKDSYGSDSKAVGHYLIVRYDLTTRGKTHFGPRASTRLVTTDGRQFSASNETPTCGPLQPGLLGHCSLLFGVDAAALEGARLTIPAQESFVFGPAVLEQASVDLGIDSAQAAALKGSTAVIDTRPEEDR